MTDEQRQIIFELLGTENKLLPVLGEIHKYTNCNLFYAWLKFKGYTGHKLWDWFNLNHSASVHKMLNFIRDDLRRNGLNAGQAGRYNH